MRKIERIFVHCTAGPQTQTVETIQNYWKVHNKWKNPGYHYIIKANGEIVQLLDESKASNGVAGYNSTSINVCYIGGVDKQGKPVDNRTEYQKESLIYILKDLKKRYPNAKIMGHREIWGNDKTKWKKACPCFDASKEYANIGVEEPKKEPVEPVKPAEPITMPEVKPEEPKDVKNPPKYTPNPIKKAKKSLLKKLFAALGL